MKMLKIERNWLIRILALKIIFEYMKTSRIIIHTIIYHILIEKIYTFRQIYVKDCVSSLKDCDEKINQQIVV